MQTYTLTLQSPTLSNQQTQEAKLQFHANTCTWLSPSACCLYNIPFLDMAALHAWSDRHQIDTALQQNVQSFNSIGLIVFDMDSTLVTIECIDEIAAYAGVKHQVAQITEKTMRGELDFSAALKQRVALLNGLPEDVLATVYMEKLVLTEGAEFLIREAKEHQIKLMLVSGGFTYFTKRLKQELNLDFAFANELDIQNGKLTGKLNGPIVDATRKAKLLKEIRDQLGLDREQVIAIGDGANDLKMLSESGIGIAFHAKPVVRKQADFALNYTGLDGVRYLFD